MARAAPLHLGAGGCQTRMEATSVRFRCADASRIGGCSVTSINIPVVGTPFPPPVATHNSSCQGLALLGPGIHEFGTTEHPDSPEIAASWLANSWMVGPGLSSGRPS